MSVNTASRDRRRPLLRDLERERSGRACQGGRRRLGRRRHVHRSARRRPRARADRGRHRSRARAVPGLLLPADRSGRRPPRHRTLRLGVGQRGGQLGAGRRVRRDHARRRGADPQRVRVPGPGADRSRVGHATGRTGHRDEFLRSLLREEGVANPVGFRQTRDFGDGVPVPWFDAVFTTDQYDFQRHGAGRSRAATTRRLTEPGFGQGTGCPKPRTR